ncbi:hypothetical protein [Streptomyces sp. NPDC093225]|uniref:hypothetical protein n=1 Tax=Streptomyces sp. NPDC093225 TaxID=3366034 RepID=UPI0037F353BC
MNTRHLSGYRGGGWTKIRRRDSTEAIIGAVTGTLSRPGLLVLGRYDDAGRLRAVGRMVPLRPEAARQVPEHPTADPGHSRTGVRFASAWGSRDVLDVVLVRPEVVAEVSADRAVDTAASTGIPCATCDCAWTSECRTYRGSDPVPPRWPAELTPVSSAAPLRGSSSPWSATTAERTAGPAAAIEG